MLISRERIATRVAEIAAEVSRDFAGHNLLLLPILKGAAIFAADLARQLTIESETEFLSVASYGAGTRTTGSPKLLAALQQPIQGRNVLVIEDILDSGLTLTYVTYLLRERNPRSLRVAALLDKQGRRVVPFTADYAGFTIENLFVIGYGMDFNEQFRDLPDICVLPEPFVAQ